MIDIIRKIADVNLTYIQQNYKAKPGCNGPYAHNDTSVRNSAHWLITYSYLWKTTKDKQYYDAIKILSNFLLLPENYGISGALYCRKDIGFNQTNGIIGQAWAIEGLLSAYETLKDRIYLDQAIKIFKVQTFDKRQNIWNCIDCNGSSGFDLVFNHQLWFAAAGSMILEYEYDNEIDLCVKSFLDYANNSGMGIRADGRIIHMLNSKLSKEDQKKYNHYRRMQRVQKIQSSSISENIERVKNKLVKIFIKKENTYNYNEYLECGYHLFNLFGFALLYKRYYSHPIYISDKFKKALAYGDNINNLQKLYNPSGSDQFNRFSFAYNSPSFEYPFVYQILNGKANQEIINDLWKYQIDNLYNESEFSFCRNTHDPVTLDARIYELIRYFQYLNSERID